MNEKNSQTKKVLKQKITRREALSTTAKLGIAVGVTAIVAGIGGYLTGSLTIPPKTVEKTITVTKTITTTRAETTISTATTTAPPTAKLPSGKIIMPLHKPPWLPGLQTLISMYEKRNPNAKIELDLMGDFATLRDKELSVCKEQLAVWDVLLMPFQMAPCIIWKALYPIKELDPTFEIDTKNILVKEWNYDYDGVLRALPLNMNNPILYYREDLFKEHGLKAPPETWEDTLEAAKTLHDPSKKMYGFIPRLADEPGLEGYCLLRSFGGDWFEDWKGGDFTVRLNDEHGLAAMETFAELLKYAPPSPSTITQADMISYMASGQGAQALIVFAGTPWMDNPTFSKVPMKVNFAPPPKGTGLPGCQHAAAEAGWSSGVALTTKNKELAWDWVKFTISYEAQLAFALAGVAPVRMDVATEPSIISKPEYRNIKAEGETMKYIVYFPNIPETPTILSTVIKELFQSIAVGKPVKEALNTAAEKLYKLMKSKGYKTSWTPNLWAK